MLNWLRNLLGDNPPCQSCEALRSEIEHLRYLNSRFMDNLLIKPVEPTPKDPIPISRPKVLPWNMRKAILEREDREKAERLRAEAKAKAGAAKPDSAITTTPTPPVDVADLEAEMGIVQQERENGT